MRIHQHQWHIKCAQAQNCLKLATYAYVSKIKFYKNTKSLWSQQDNHSAFWYDAVYIQSAYVHLDVSYLPKSFCIANIDQRCVHQSPTVTERDWDLFDTLSAALLAVRSNTEAWVDPTSNSSWNCEWFNELLELCMALDLEPLSLVGPSDPLGMVVGRRW